MIVKINHKPKQVEITTLNVRLHFFPEPFSIRAHVFLKTK